MCWPFRSTSCISGNGDGEIVERSSPQLPFCLVTRRSQGKRLTVYLLFLRIFRGGRLWVPSMTLFAVAGLLLSRICTDFRVGRQVLQGHPAIRACSPTRGFYCVYAGIAPRAH